MKPRPIWLLFTAIWVGVAVAVLAALNVVRVTIPSALHFVMPYVAILPIVLVFLVVVMLAFRFAETFVFLLFLLFFPLIGAVWLLWRTPFVVYRFVKFFQRMPAPIVDVATSVQLTLIMFIVGSLSVLCVLKGWYPQLSGFFLAILLGWITFLHTNLFILPFRPGLTQRALVNLFLQVWTYDKAHVEQPARPIFQGRGWSIGPPRTSPGDKFKLTERFANWLVSHLESLRGKPVPLKMFVRNLAAYFFLATFLFAVIYYDVLTMNPHSFALLLPRSFFDLYLFSVANMLTTNFADVLPRSTLARTLATLQIVLSVSIGVVLLLLFTELNKVRFEQELDEGIRDVKQVLKEIEERRAAQPGTILPPATESESPSENGPERR